MDDVVPPAKSSISFAPSEKTPWNRIHLELQKKPNIFPDVESYIMLHPMKTTNLITIWLFNIAMERSTIFNR